MKVNGRKFNICEIENPTREQANAIGYLRSEVWNEETIVNPVLLPECWLDHFDWRAKHWVVLEDGALVGAARLTISSLQESVDGHVWQKAGRSLPEPVANLSRLVVHKQGRNLGIGQILNLLRIEMARENNAKIAIVMASKVNKNLLHKIGFSDTGLTITYPNRPFLEFSALEKPL